MWKDADMGKLADKPCGTYRQGQLTDLSCHLCTFTGQITRLPRCAAVLLPNSKSSCRLTPSLVVAVGHHCSERRKLLARRLAVRRGGTSGPSYLSLTEKTEMIREERRQRRPRKPNETDWGGGDFWPSRSRSEG